MFSDFDISWIRGEMFLELFSTMPCYLLVTSNERVLINPIQSLRIRCELLLLAHLHDSSSVGLEGLLRVGVQEKRKKVF